MINWSNIKEQYPKAWERFLGWDEEPDYEYHVRKLYDFFDEEGILIGIQIRTTSEPSFWFQMEINKRGVATTPYSAGYFLTRTEAEQQAFLKAFSILEERLSK